MNTDLSGTRLLAAGITAFLLLPAAHGASQAEDKATASKRLGDSALPRMPELLAKTHGIYIVPNYGRAALGVGVAGGSGVPMAKKSGGSWGNPAFFDIGNISVGLQAGAEGGPIAGRK